MDNREKLQQFYTHTPKRNLIVCSTSVVLHVSCNATLDTELQTIHIVLSASEHPDRFITASMNCVWTTDRVLGGWLRMFY